ncbi:hypothetical protein RJ641_015872 [Dillenia turbinata]|uniref:Uncharacterized protein n=1 Tax=Dillenia turbinata TaxID=194707 RepID=A0AAN8Z440_9MAGN
MKTHKGHVVQLLIRSNKTIIRIRTLRRINPHGITQDRPRHPTARAPWHIVIPSSFQQFRQLNLRPEIILLRTYDFFMPGIRRGLSRLRRGLLNVPSRARGRPSAAYGRHGRQGGGWRHCRERRRRQRLW